MLHKINENRTAAWPRESARRKNARPRVKKVKVVASKRRNCAHWHYKLQLKQPNQNARNEYNSRQRQYCGIKGTTGPQTQDIDNSQMSVWGWSGCYSVVATTSRSRSSCTVVQSSSVQSMSVHALDRSLSPVREGCLSNSADCRVRPCVDTPCVAHTKLSLHSGSRPERSRVLLYRLEPRLRP